jgi:hypothetical protein
MKREISSFGLEHRFNHEIVGLGHKIVISNLSKDGNYDISLFEKSGFCSLVAVPIMTYRIHGVLGAAYKVRKRVGGDFSDLLAVIASLIGMSLSKSMLHKRTTVKEKPPVTGSPLSSESSTGSSDIQSTAVAPGEVADTMTEHKIDTKKNSEDFQEHIRRMRAFYRSHLP